MRPTIIATVLDEEYRHAQIEIRNHCIAGGREPLPAGSSGELATQKNSQKGVTVAVTPQNLSGDAETWDFNIVFDAHSQDLSDDLAKAAVLSDGSGARYEPVAWDGAGPGGHHREGVLRFKRIAPQPQTVKLRSSRDGESGARVFRWELVRVYLSRGRDVNSSCQPGRRK